MTQDRRLWPANDRVAHPDLTGQVDVPVAKPVLQTVRVPMTDLRPAPGGGRDKNLIFGAAFEVLEERDGWAFGRDPMDGYVGYIEAGHLGEFLAPSHRVIARSAHLYEAADFKSPDIAAIPFGGCVQVLEQDGVYCRVSGGQWMMSQHLVPVTERAEDWVGVAESFLGTPYLWGGNTAFGIDCSGLVQLSMQAAGHPCPRDSDMQEAAFAAALEPYRRGDLVFWKGHVGILLDEETLLHANAHHMAVAVEPLAAAIERIGAKEFGDVTKVARPVAPA